MRAADRAGNQRLVLVPFTVGENAGLITAISADPPLFSPNGDAKVDRTMVRYRVATPAHITLDVVDATAAVMKTLSNASNQAPGAYDAIWDGTNDAGARVPDGQYVIRIAAVAAADAGVTQTERTAVTVDATPPALTSDNPVGGAYLRHPIGVSGSIADRHLSSYTLTYAPSDAATAVVFDEGNQPRSGHAFGPLPELADGLYVMRWSATDAAQNSAEQRITFSLDNTPPQVELSDPVDGALAGGSTPAVDVKGKVLDAHLESWTLRVGAGLEPASWTALADGSSVVSVAALLAAWNVQALGDGPYTLSLVATDKAGASSETRIRVVVDNTPPHARIVQPANLARIGGPTEILGDAFDVNFKSARLALSPGDAAAANQFELLAEVTAAVSNGRLLSWQALPPDGTYTLRLTVEDQLGQTSEARTTVKIDTEPPPPPTVLTAVVEQRKQARLNWTASLDPDLAGYHVYRAGTKITATPIVPVTYLDQDLTDGRHRYQVKAVDTSGLESAASNEAEVTIDLTPPSTRIQIPADGSVVSGLIDVRGTAAAPDDFKEYRLLVGVGHAAGLHRDSAFAGTGDVRPAGRVRHHFARRGDGADLPPRSGGSRWKHRRCAADRDGR